jgi:hypothetical protein
MQGYQNSTLPQHHDRVNWVLEQLGSGLGNSLLDYLQCYVPVFVISNQMHWDLVTEGLPSTA